MRWFAVVAVLLVAGGLAGCSPEQATSLAAVPMTIPAPGTEPSSVLAVTVTSLPATATLPVRPSATPLAIDTAALAPSATPRATDTATPAPSAPPSPTLTPTLPPLMPPTAGEPLALSLGWQFNANGHLTGGAAVQMAGRRLYLLTSLGRTLYALAENGETAWQARAAGPAYALAILEGDRIAVGDDAGSVTLFDARGQRLWRHTLSSRVTSLEGWLDGLLVGGWDERLTFLNDGVDADRVRWQTNPIGPVSAVATLPGLALAGTLDGQVQAVDPNGKDAWHVDAGAPVIGLEGVERSPRPVVLAGLQDGRILALDAGGALLWQQSLGLWTEGSPILHVIDLGKDKDIPPEIVAGTGGVSPTLALLTIDGVVLWRVTVPSPVQAITATDLDGDGTSEILAGLSSGEVQAYDEQGGLRGSVHAGLAVWGLEAAEEDSAGPTAGRSVLVRADVVAWRLEGGRGTAGGPWLPPPAMVGMTPSPLPVATERKEGEAILVFVGDVAPGRSMESQLARYGPGYPWQGLESLLQEADLAVANLECVLTVGGDPLKKPYLLRAHPLWGQTLAEGGFGLVTLANNHALDYGQMGLDETLDTLAALDIAAVGAGRSSEEAHCPALFTLNGVKVAVLGYAAARWNGSADVPATDRLAWAVPSRVEADVRAVRDEADLVVVLLHAGAEYAAEPSPDQVAVAHAAVAAGADLVVGHHPHVTQTVERYRHGLIVYSLGDTLFDIPRPAAMRGDLLRVHATREGLVQAELWPFWIEDAIRPRLLDDGGDVPRVEVVFP